MTIRLLETEDDARRLPAVAAIYTRAHESPGRGVMAEGNREMLTAAVEFAGLTLGAYEERILLEWFAGTWEPQTVAVVAGVIRRAHLTGMAARTGEDGSDERG